MRKIASLVIGASVAGSRRPNASKYATLPWRATKATAPGTWPLATRSLIAVDSRSSAADDRPTSSGLAVGRGVVILASPVASAAGQAIMPRLAADCDKPA